jgi:methyl-accepting chemotaxis protein
MAQRANWFERLMRPEVQEIAIIDDSHEPAHKLSFFSRSTLLALIILPLALSALFFSLTNFWRARAVAVEHAHSQMSLIRNAKAEQLQAFVQTYNHLIQTTASSALFVEAARSLPSQALELKSRLDKPLEVQKTDLLNFYDGVFAQEYKRRNNIGPASHISFVQNLPPETIALQSYYLVANPKPLGKKSEIDFLEDGSNYTKWHALVQPAARSLVSKFGLKDVFIVDAKNALVVYSFEKDISFGADLDKGVFGQSPLAAAFKLSVQAPKLAPEVQQAAWLTDVAPFYPSFDEQSMFISYPIMDAGQVIAVLIFNLPLESINQLLNFSKQWEQNGLGKTGDVYLVGADRVIRTNSRPVLADIDTYLNSLKSLIPDAVVTQIKSRKSDVGLRSLDSAGIKRAVNGISETAQKDPGHDQLLRYDSYRKIPVVGAYGPIKLLNLNYGLMVEIEQSEVFAPANGALYRTLIGALLFLVLATTILSWLVKRWFAHNELTGPMPQALSVPNPQPNLAIATSKMPTSVASKIKQLHDHANTWLARARPDQVSAPVPVEAFVKPAESYDQIAAQALNASQLLQAIGRDNAQLEKTLEKVHQTVVAAQGAVQVCEAQIIRLGARPQQIDDSLSMIETFAQRLTTLSLNASLLTAPSAMDHSELGKITDELRVLADSARHSVKSLTQLIQPIRVEAEQTSATIEPLLAQLTKLEKLVALAQEQIVQHGLKQSQATGVILAVSTQMQSQAQGLGQLAAQAQALNHLNERTAEQFQAQIEHSQRLSEYSRDLLEQVNELKRPR